MCFWSIITREIVYGLDPLSIIIVKQLKKDDFTAANVTEIIEITVSCSMRGSNGNSSAAISAGVIVAVVIANLLPIIGLYLIMCLSC